MSKVGSTENKTMDAVNDAAMEAEELEIEREILEVISILRGRKARPDSTRITGLMARKFKIDVETSRVCLERMADRGRVYKVSYKNNISYRDPKRWHPAPQETVLAPPPDLVRIPVRVPKRSVLHKQRDTSGDNYSSSSQGAQDLTMTPQKRRLPSTGSTPDLKKMRASSQGGEQSSESAASVVEDRCDYCLQPSGTCPSVGRVEDLLSCTDCSAKAHPACLNYSVRLAARALRSPWQCTDCKTCGVCRKSDNPDMLLFCDSCDKGYHMNCISPPLSEKPTGAWECAVCEMEAEEGGSQETVGEDRRPTPGLSDHEHDTPPANGFHITGNSNGDGNGMLTNGVCRNPDVPDVRPWNVDQVTQYFRDKGHTDAAEALKDQSIDGIALLLLKRSDILSCFNLKLGLALKLYKQIYKIQYNYCSCERPPINY